jgi:DNA polymerase III subunit beta
MQVTIERANLLKSLNHVHRVVERRNTIPILSNVLLRANGSSLEMKATDLDLEINEATPAMVERGGATTSYASCRKAARCRYRSMPKARL